MGKSRLVCAECRQRHKAPRGAKSFPQNRYILDMLRLLKNQPEKDRVLFAQCPEHKRDCSLYCKNVGCNKSICQLCYIRNHKPNDVVDVAQEEKEHLELQIDLLTKETTQYRQTLLLAKNDIRENTAQSLKRLENKKKFLAKTMNRLIKQTRQQMIAADKDINDNVVALSQLKHTLENLKEKINTSGIATEDDRKAFEISQKSMTEKAGYYNYYNFQDEALSENQICGTLVDKKLDLPKLLVTSTFYAKGELPLFS